MPNHAQCTSEPRVRTAYRIMLQVLVGARRDRKSPDEIDRAIRDAYPWGERRGWRYRAWLMARREFYETHGLPIKRSQRIAEAIRESDA